MGTSGCRAITEEGTEWVRTSEAHNILERLEQLGAEPETYIGAFISHLEPHDQALLRDELPALPAGTLDIIVDSWRRATTAGKSFALRSEAPASPLTYARARRVRVAVESDEHGVSVSITHMPGRHAEWYQGGRGVEQALAVRG